jgi:hypothetical protein
MFIFNKSIISKSREYLGGITFAAALSLSACGGGGSTGSDATSTVGAPASTTTTGSNSGTTGTTGTATPAPSPTPASVSTPNPTPTPTPTPTPAPTPAPGSISSEAYTITVYYTAVESFHTDAAQNVSGCLIRECSFGNNLIGNYPASFIKATKTEGTGRITSGANAGKYLNWSVDVGYWLDTIPSDGYGGALVPFRTAAADAIALPKGAQFRLVAPLKQEDGSALEATSANRLLSATWLINDQFTPGLGGALHLDVYIGEEDRVNFTNTSPLYTTLSNVKISRL